ncbi:MAG: cyclic pyranopterin monophosphate synthase MoaC, partial [Candidatus Edwardsbacteria bacterium]|nr:cyclic pyranopterin monophosphate synthase MoaC [Candidatus Edwardsbacteria bacterium]
MQNAKCKIQNAKLSHVDQRGKTRMVDVSDKPLTARQAVARGFVKMKPGTLRLIERNQIAKGDVLAVAKIAGIQAAKATSSLIPLCHPLAITGIEIEFALDKKRSGVAVATLVKCRERTGAEMEALAAAAAACLTIYDMAKAADKGMV